MASNTEIRNMNCNIDGVEFQLPATVERTSKGMTYLVPLEDFTPEGWVNEILYGLRKIDDGSGDSQEKRDNVMAQLCGKENIRTRSSKISRLAKEFRKIAKDRLGTIGIKVTEAQLGGTVWQIKESLEEMGRKPEGIEATLAEARENVDDYERRLASIDL